MFVLLHVVIALIVGMGLRFDNTFSTLTDNHLELVSNQLSLYFNIPFFSCLIIILYMIMGYSFLGIILIFLKKYLNPLFVIISFVFLYMLILFNMHYSFGTIFPYIFLNNYIMLPHSISLMRQRYYIFFIVEVFLIIVMLFTIRKYWYKKITLHFKSTLLFWNLSMLFSRKNLILLLTLLFISISSKLVKYGSITFNDLLILQFIGHSTGYFNLLNFINLLIYNGLPIYLLCIFVFCKQKVQKIAEKFT